MLVIRTQLKTFEWQEGEWDTGMFLGLITAAGVGMLTYYFAILLKGDNR